METAFQAPSENMDECSYRNRANGPAIELTSERKWKIIIADDEEEVHAMTRMVLSDYLFDGWEIEFFSAYSGEETLALMRRHPDTAMILLDVVMEDDDSGLKVARAIRRELANLFVRIVLRTGQPGKAPELEVISDYDINDYKEKTELTATKLYTTITSSLRNYRDMKIIEQNRRGLEKIIEASTDLFEPQSLFKFAQGVLMQLSSILHLDDSTAFFLGSAFTASKLDGDFKIIAGMGKYESCTGRQVREVVSGEVMKHLKRAMADRTSFFTEDAFAGFFATGKDYCHLLYLKGCRAFTEMDKSLITIFSSNVAVAFKNISLTQEIIDTQKEVIFTLGEVIESRSRETGNHVRRVAELCYLLALKAGESESRAELLRLAAPLHDVGKVGIPDALLLKEARLTREEYEIIKRHTEIGYHILKSSHRDILEAAVIVARQHHEWWNGKGYSLGLRGEQIHIFGRITSIADVFDALLHRRVYKSPWDPEQVRAYLEHNRGTQFDPRLIDIFLENFEEFLAVKRKYPDRS